MQSVNKKKESSN